MNETMPEVKTSVEVQPSAEIKTSAKEHYITAGFFIATLLSTTAAGSIHLGGDPFHKFADMTKGLPFSISLMIILLSHELGHFFAAKAHGVQTSFPIFVPGPSIIGTFGAFIRLKSQITNKRALIDIGAFGPVSGFFVSLLAVWIGLSLSEIAMVVGVETVKYGRPIIFTLIQKYAIGMPPIGHYLKLHPIAFAGWIGMFLTSMNLIPIGQLDGGHILYAVFENKHKTISMVLPVLLVGLGFLGWPGWYLWAFFTVFLGPAHPTVKDMETNLDFKRKLLAALCLIIFILTFIPAPFYF